MSSTRIFFACIAVLGVAACGNDTTQVLVVSDTDLDVPGELDEIRTLVTNLDGVSTEARADLTEQAPPRTLTLLHEQGPLGPHRVQVFGRLGGATVVSRVASFTFVPGETRVLTMHLVGACRGTSCGADETCSETGCRPVTVAQDELLEWTGEPPTLGAGPSPTPDGGMACVPEAEVCNDADDDCDDLVDEDFDLMTDDTNCGSCGNVCGGRDQCCSGTCQRRC